MLVAVTAPTATQKHDGFTLFQKFNNFIGSQIGHHRTYRQKNFQINTVRAVHTFGFTGTTIFRTKLLFVPVLSKNTDITHGSHQYVTTVSPVTARGPAVLFVLFMKPRHNTASTVARFHVNFKFVDKSHIF